MTIELKIPNVGESIQEVQIGQWLKHEGDRVAHDETIVELETDKASMELPAPVDGVISKIVKHDGDSVAVGEVIAYLDPAGQPEGEEAASRLKDGAEPEDGAEASGSDPISQTAAKPPRSAGAPKEMPGGVADSHAKSSQPAASAAEAAFANHEGTQEPAEDPAAPPSVRRLLRERHIRPHDVPPTGEGGRLLRDDVLRYAEEHSKTGSATGSPAAAAAKPLPEQKQASPASAPSLAIQGHESQKIVPMSLIRRRIAERLVEAQQNAALLTTFNEIDMSGVAELRALLREPFQQKYGVKLGMLSFFVKAVVEALREFPAVNAEVRGTDIVYRNAYHIGIAIGAKRGLVVPVLRDADRLSFAQIEQAIDDFAKRAESNKLEPAELSGGTFTISNGGIYGSLLSTPIVNPPQSGVLGLHAIEQRPVAREGQVVIRPMMYVALTYDHRLIDGREAVGFLKRVKETVESPARLLLGV